MNEVDWLAATNPASMLEYLRGKTNARKLRLFACACCRDLGDLLDGERLQAVEVAERFADGLVGPKELTVVRTTVLSQSQGNTRFAGWAAYNAAMTGHPDQSVEDTCNAAAEARGSEAMSPLPFTGPERATAWELALNSAAARQADLLRHIIGNPFRSARTPPVWPAVVTQLAAALYGGQPVAFALHDSLLEAGEAKMAEHFRDPHHPKGCWILDRILDKE